MKLYNAMLIGACFEAIKLTSEVTVEFRIVGFQDISGFLSMSIIYHRIQYVPNHLFLTATP